MKCGFKTAYEMFEHALLANRRNAGRKSIYIKCPRCGRIGRLIAFAKNFLGRKYRVVHNPRTQTGCTFSPTTEGHDYLEKVYNKYRKELETGSALEWELHEFGDYLLNVEGYKRSTAYTAVHFVRKVLSRYGEFKDSEELREFLQASTNCPRHKIYKYVSAYQKYLCFKQWKHEQRHLARRKD